ncbi:hypothetical protein SBF1_3010004 [Candidatus Desulfosporosinus infrequens]|uniref:Uncharacterized protein n=1 Tax=Candidatus Desulfosporosinus infrequens TaxID=2043169 RepID=A0A2U3KWN4_9FIRM|nr:hypothetical protein SBF1_3010004 [Candidatus Desulfosporosinus infrequens]
MLLWKYLDVIKYSYCQMPINHGIIFITLNVVPSIELDEGNLMS